MDNTKETRKVDSTFEVIIKKTMMQKAGIDPEERAVPAGPVHRMKVLNGFSRSRVLK